MSGGKSKFFLDTNILVYSFDNSHGVKRDRAQDLIDLALSTKGGVVSFQVVQETLAVMLGKFKRTIRPEHAGEYLENILLPLCEVVPDAALYRQALSIKRETGFSFYDCLIVAAAVSSGCTHLYTEDLQNGRTIGGLAILDPFTTIA